MNKRPNVLHGETRKIRVGCGNLYVTLNHREDDRYKEYPLNEIFLTPSFKDKEALSCCKTFLDTLAKLLTFMVRQEPPDDRTLYRAKVIKQIRGHVCPKNVIGTAESCVDGVARTLLCYWGGHKFKEGRCWICGYRTSEASK